MRFKVDKLYTYCQTHDTGFAPNPFWGRCTLACCKPKIRKSIGDKWNDNENVWIIGVTPKNRGNEISYIMKVKDVLSFTEYYQRFPEKRPSFDNSTIHKCGDNIYKPDENAIAYEQLRSLHSQNPLLDDAWETDRNKLKVDLGGKYVLVADEYIYFGKNTVPLIDDMKTIIAGRGHKCRFDTDTLKAVEAFINNHSELVEKGSVVGCPHRWPKEDESWKEEI